MSRPSWLRRKWARYRRRVLPWCRCKGCWGPSLVMPVGRLGKVRGNYCLEHAMENLIRQAHNQERGADALLECITPDWPGDDASEGR